MEIHRYEKLWTAAALLLIVGFIATVTYGALGPGVTMVDDSGGTIDSGSLGETQFGDPGVTQTGENQYEVHVVARQFLFQPGTGSPIRVPANSEVTFYITSADVVHGFEVAGTNVSEVTVRFDEPAQYGIVCHEYCGAAHHTMAGQLVVVPEDEYSAEGS